eukprot:scaffold603_cov404-Prasinococcus_capsulatus_cf.AAC.3
MPGRQALTCTMRPGRLKRPLRYLEVGDAYGVLVLGRVRDVYHKLSWLCRVHGRRFLQSVLVVLFDGPLQPVVHDSGEGHTCQWGTSGKTVYSERRVMLLEQMQPDLQRLRTHWCGNNAVDMGALEVPVLATASRRTQGRTVCGSKLRAVPVQKARKFSQVCGHRWTKSSKWIRPANSTSSLIASSRNTTGFPALARGTGILRYLASPGIRALPMGSFAEEFCGHRRCCRFARRQAFRRWLLSDV